LIVILAVPTTLGAATACVVTVGELVGLGLPFALVMTPERFSKLPAISNSGAVQQFLATACAALFARFRRVRFAIVENAACFI
jgi:hypothetical protein